MPALDELRALVDQMPEPDNNGTYANMDQAKIKRMDGVVQQLLEDGRDSALGLIDLLADSGNGLDVKARYALHLLAVRVSGPGDDEARAEFALSVASQVDSGRPVAVRKYLIEQLQVAGGKEVVATLGKATRDPELCDVAARALTAIREGAAAQLLDVLPTARGRSRLSVIQKLAVLRAKQAADAFKQALDDSDPDVRIAAAWGISRIADASLSSALLEAAEAHEGWERINETDACLSLADSLAAAGKKDEAAAIYAHLHTTRTDTAESHVREAAERGLAACGESGQG